VKYVGFKDYPPDDDVSERLQVNHRLNEIPGIAIPDDMATRASWPQLKLDQLRAPATRPPVFAIFDEVAGRLEGGI
jgi:hypothetical protein